MNGHFCQCISLHGVKVGYETWTLTLVCDLHQNEVVAADGTQSAHDRRVASRSQVSGVNPRSFGTCDWVLNEIMLNGSRPVDLLVHTLSHELCHIMVYRLCGDQYDEVRTELLSSMLLAIHGWEAGLSDLLSTLWESRAISYGGLVRAVPSWADDARTVASWLAEEAGEIARASGQDEAFDGYLDALGILLGVIASYPPSTIARALRMWVQSQDTRNRSIDRPFVRVMRSAISSLRTYGEGIRGWSLMTSWPEYKQQTRRRLLEALLASPVWTGSDEK
jgi:hypothetical protein